MASTSRRSWRSHTRSGNPIVQLHSSRYLDQWVVRAEPRKLPHRRSCPLRCCIARCSALPKLNQAALGAPTEGRTRDVNRTKTVIITGASQGIEAKGVVDPVIYLIEARYVTGEVLHVDGDAHVDRW